LTVEPEVTRVEAAPVAVAPVQAAPVEAAPVEVASPEVAQSVEDIAVHPEAAAEAERQLDA